MRLRAAVKRLYNIFVAMLLILAIAAGIGWIYSIKHERSYRWSHHIRPFFDEQSDAVRGFRVDAYWSLSLAHGRVTVSNEYSADGDTDGYQSPPGFPIDEQLAQQYKRMWSPAIEKEDRDLKHHRFDTAEADACDENLWWGRLGFGWESSRPLPPYPQNFSGGAGRLACTVPIWAIFLLLLVLPAFKSSTLIRRRRRIAAGKCLRCGYDLRASSEICPECGLRLAHQQ